jgi:HD-GYP domain-containing protein (c-di-GMP phosphodiesterase class II)
MQATEHPELVDKSLMIEGASEAMKLVGSTKNILASLDLAALLERLANTLSSFIEVDALSLKLADLTEELLLVNRGEAYKQEIIYGSRALSTALFSQEAITSGSPIVINDITKMDRYSYPSYVTREGFKALIAVPLMSGRGQIGIVTVYLKSPSQVSSHVLAIISIVASVTAAAVENSQLVQRIEKNYFSTVEALATAIEAKDPYTRGHSKRVTQFAIVLAERFGVSDTDVRNLQYGATLHDVGKIGVSGEILNKRGRLTHEEYDTIKTHPVIGDHIIERVDFLQGARPIVRGHHERFDGTGYPDGLRDEEIPFLARIVAVVDFFDALTSDRPYRKAYSVAQTMSIMRDGIGREFDPVVAKEFLQISCALAKPEQVPVAIPQPAGL